MATEGGPKIVTDGLVLHLDAANDKSFRGEPTVNLAYNSNGSIDWSTANLTASITRSTVLVNSVYKITSTTGGSFRMRFNASKLVDGVRYNLSFKYRIITGGPNFNMTDWNDTSLSNKIDTVESSYNFSSASGVRSTYNSTYRFMDFNISPNTAVEIWDVQLEQGNYPTPFVDGTRGTTVATEGGWADRSGNSNHGELVNGPTFDNDNLGGIEFDGVNDNITVPFNSATMNFSQAQTICMWLKPGTGSNSARRNPYNQAYGGSGTITHETNSRFNYYFGTHGGNSQPYVGRGSGFTVLPNELAFISVTRSQSLNICRWYKNGQAGAFSNAGGYAATNNGSSPILIANGYTNEFVGGIHYVAVYNRYMSQEEIQQIYNATKSRFNL